jgi:hypothetical protein
LFTATLGVGVRFCGTTKPAFTSTAPMVSNTNQVQVLFDTPALKGLITSLYYSGFKLCFKASEQQLLQRVTIK